MRWPKNLKLWMWVAGLTLLLGGARALAQGGVWTTKAPMLVPSGFGAGAVVGDNLYVLGGFNSSLSPPLSTVESYDPKTDAWVEKAAMPTPRAFMGAASLDGILYVVSGCSDMACFVPYLDAYNPKTNRWTSRAPILTARMNAAEAAADGKLYAMGGNVGDCITCGGVIASVVAYDPATNTWAEKTPMPAPGADLVAASVDGVIYVLGPTQSVLAYDPKADSWTAKAPMPTRRYGFAVAVVDGIMYAFGGDDGRGNFLSTVESYDPKTNSWNSEPPMPTPRKAMVADTIEGTIYVAGGFVVDSSTGQSVWLATNEAFTPYLSVTIRVNPTTINLRSNAKIKVAILSSSTFDATSVIPDSVKLSGALADTERNGTPIFSFDDVNDDGILDLVLTFRARDLQLTKADKQVVLKGQTFAGQLIKGVATVRIVP
ncbi:MAG TPA: kelch repeat-containing protein [Terriglobia bacterium]|nr:kelch repeat-containing protein [Terriglobia bacterium]